MSAAKHSAQAGYLCPHPSLRCWHAGRAGPALAAALQCRAAASTHRSPPTRPLSFSEGPAPLHLLPASRPGCRRESLDVVGFVQKADCYTPAYLESVTVVHTPPRAWSERLAWWWLLAGGPPALCLLSCGLPNGLHEPASSLARPAGNSAHCSCSANARGPADRHFHRQCCLCQRAPACPSRPALLHGRPSHSTGRQALRPTEVVHDRPDASDSLEVLHNSSAL